MVFVVDSLKLWYWYNGG